MLSKIVQYISILTILGFLLSYSYLNGFYKYYKIDILNYVSYSEILIRLTPLPLLLISLGYANYGWVKYFSTNNFSRSKMLESSFFGFLSKHYIKLMGLLLLVALFLLILMANSDYILYRYSWLFPPILLLTYFIGDIKQITAKGMGITIVVSIFCLSFIISESLGRRKADIRFNNSTKSAIIKTSDTTYITSDELILIDETQSTVFLCYKHDTTTLALNREDIKSLRYKK